MTTFLYNPDRKGKQQLIEEFVVRNEILNDIIQDIKSSDMKTPEQHYLIVGQRGTGKTTLLHRIKYAIEDSRKINGWLIPIVFNEEQYNVSELANLWENIGHILEDYYGFIGIYSEMEKQIEKKNFEELCYEILEKYLDNHKKKLVLLIDNIGDLLKKMEDKEIRRLREILQTKNHLRLIAGSSFYLDSILDYQQPFFEFFKVIRLDGLNKVETKKLLLKLGDIYNQKATIETVIIQTPERIETLRILTGGVPRTIALMFKIFTDYEHENSLKDLEKVLDAVTPLYKHRMDDLPKQQQKIVDAVAKNWDPISVKELKEKVRLDSKVISSQLRQLQKNQVIDKIETNTKNHLYSLKERFWNIWYLMRYGRKFDRERVIWLVKFLECWYSNSELEKRVSDFIGKIKKAEISESMLEFYSTVYSSIKGIDLDVRINLQESLPSNIAKTISIDSIEVIKRAEEKVKQEKYDDALSLIRKINYTDVNNKKKVVNFLLSFPSEKLLHFYNKVKETKNFLISDLHILYYTLINFSIFIALTQEITDKQYENLKSIFYQIRKFQSFKQLGSLFETSLINLMLKSFIVGKKSNVAYEFFDNEDKEKLISQFEISYILIDFFRNKEDESILLKVAEEKKQIILQEINDIKVDQKKF